MACHCQHQQLRSTSLPVRPHALVREVEDELLRIRSGAAASGSSLAARLGDAYGSIEELVRLHGVGGPRWRGAGVEAELDASAALLDLCQRAMDAAASAKQHARAARRALRRGDAALAGAAVRRYVRCLAKAAGKGKKTPYATGVTRKLLMMSRRAAPENADGEMTAAAAKVLSEAAAVTVAVLQCVMSSLSRRALDTTRKSSRWRVVSRLLRAPSASEWSLGVTCSKDLEGHEGAMSAQEMLQEMEDGVEAVETGLEHLFRQIVQTRVALLNMLTL